MLEFVADTAREGGLEDYRLVVNVGAGGGQSISTFIGTSSAERCEACRDEPDRADRGGATAMRERDAERRDALRLILASPRSAEKEQQRPLHDEEEPAGPPARTEAAGRGCRGVPEPVGARSKPRARSATSSSVLEEFMPGLYPRRRWRRSSTTRSPSVARRACATSAADGGRHAPSGRACRRVCRSRFVREKLA